MAGQSKNRKFAKVATDVDANGNITADGISPDIDLGGGVTVYSTRANLPASGNTAGDQAYVTENNRLYIWNGSGWYNIALINLAPSIQTVLDSDGGTTPFILAIDGTATTITITATDSDGDPITYTAEADSDFNGLATISNVDNVFTVTPFSQDSATTASGTITFKADDGVNIASSGIQTFTLNFLSELWNDVVLSIGTSSTNGLNNSTFVDRSTNTHTVTPSGTPTQTAFHPYLDNWSVEFDGNSSYLSVSNTVGDWGTGDFTIEAWVYNIGNGNILNALISAYNGNNSQKHWSIQVDRDTEGNIYFYGGVTLVINSSIKLNKNEWTHIAVCRNSGTTTIYVNGQSGGSASDSINYVQPSPIGIGSDLFSPSNYEFTGYISNLRLVKGTAIYTSAFNPPTEKLTAVSGTSLLTCQSNRFIDNSTNGHTITANGNPEVSAFNPFGQGSEYAAGENKGSTYFDGATSTRLTLPSDTGFAFGTGAYTIEAWVYISVTTTGAIIFDSGTASGSLSFLAEGGQLKLSKYGTGLIIQSSAGAVANNKFSHLAIARSSTGSNDTRLFVDGILVGTGTDSNNWTTTTTPSVGGVNLANYTLNGYISDLRVIKGTALYTTNFTPPTSPVGNTNASLYLPMDNAGIFDKTGNNTLTLVGNTSTSTTQTKFADTAMYFDGTGDYISGEVTSLTDFGLGDFTIECWLNLSTINQFNHIVLFGRDQNSGLTCDVSSSNYPRITAHIGGSWSAVVSGSTTLSADTWYHLAYARNGSSFKIYVNGVEDGSATNSNAITDPSSDANAVMQVAYLRTAGGADRYLHGYIENLQILKGVAKYTSNFTVPTREQGQTYQAES